jgi:hypothetical protein
LAALPHYQDSPLFTPREKAAFHFAELMAGTINRYRKTCSTNYASIFPNRRFWN